MPALVRYTNYTNLYSDPAANVLESGYATFCDRSDSCRCRTDRKLRVLLLSDQFHSLEGGTEQHIVFLLQHLPRVGIEVQFALLTGLVNARPDDFPIPPQVIGGMGTNRFTRKTKLVSTVARMIREQEIDVVHTFAFTAESIARLAVILGRRGTVVASRRNLGYWHTVGSTWIARLSARSRIHYVANCEAAKAHAVAREWIPARRVTVIHNPVIRERVAEGVRGLRTRKELGLAPNEFAVGIVATVRPVKDHRTFFHAARQVLDRFPQTRFFVVGFSPPDQLCDATATVEQLGLAHHVTFLGAVPNPFCILPLLDVGVLTSRSEAFSNALLEYAAAGLPSVATDVGGAKDIVEDGTTGFLVPVGAHDLIADRICRLLSDPQLRRQFGDRARERATALFSEERTLGEYAQLYNCVHTGNQTCERTRATVVIPATDHNTSQ